MQRVNLRGLDSGRKIEAGARGTNHRKAERVGRKKDADYGRNGHKYLTPDQVQALIKAARSGRHGNRDALMISLAWHHGLRVSELIALRWSDIDWKRADMAVTRLKNGNVLHRGCHTTFISINVENVGDR
jgi:integrase